VQLVCLCGRRGEEKVVCFLSDFFFLFGHLFWCWFFLRLVRSFVVLRGFGLVSWPCCDSVGCKEAWCFTCCFS